MKFNPSKCKVLTVSRRKSPFQTSYHFGSELNHVGLLRRTCLSLTDSTIRRTLYLFLVKSQQSYATQVWLPTLHTTKTNLEKLKSVQRRVTWWILSTKSGGIPCKERLLSPNLLPLAYDREIKDLTFFYKALHGHYDIDLLNFVSFLVIVALDRNCNNLFLLLKIPSCKTNTL